MKRDGFWSRAVASFERALARGVIEEIYFCPEHFRDSASQALVDQAAKGDLAVCQLAPGGVWTRSPSGRGRTACSALPARGTSPLRI